MLFWGLGASVAIIFFTLGRRRIDYRVVLLGAVLPDLIDKPIGRILFRDEFENSRIFAHTFLFSIVLLLFVQLFLRGDNARRWFVLPITTLIHLGLDGMWNLPITLFWPFFGWHFPKVPMQSYWAELLTRPFVHPVDLIKELVGLAILIYFAVAFELHKPGPRRTFFRTGILPSSRGEDLSDDRALEESSA